MASLLQQEHFYYVLSVHPDPSIPYRISFWLKEALLDGWEKLLNKYYFINFVFNVSDSAKPR